MSTLFALIVLLAILMAIIGGEVGIRSFFSILINILLLVIVAILIATGLNIIILTLIFIPLKLATIIFVGTGNKKVGWTSFISSLIIACIVILIIIAGQYFAQAAGMNIEANDVLIGQSQQPGLSYPLISVTVAIFSALGAIAEAAVAITAGLLELKNNNSTLSTYTLKQSGFSIGRDIIGTSLNTITYGIFGSLLPLILWFYPLHYSIGEIINDKLVINNLLIMFYSLIGVILVVPLSIYLVTHPIPIFKKSK
ncbi:YibE/F family protein [Lactobacillus sp. PV037]|uniref:YibE/F family protein n=1 Tax=Lactobacillus sp. PV037 TaxID=2594496 RepID=UPI00223F0E4C|nr:YibE/F family protein [Lactobacillus sp. PV037]QNQ84024.1 YibE/F family protein [Lactobacillus sp. PV037]